MLIFASQGFLIRTASRKNPWPSELSKSRVCLGHVMSQLIYSLTNENVRTSSDIFTTMAASMDINVDLIKKKFKIGDLRDIQLRGIRAIANGKDLFVGCKTGSGKSLIYETFPFLNPGSSVLVLAPLESIIKEQSERLQKIGFSVTSLTTELHDCESDFIFGSPEAVLDKYRASLLTKSFQKRVKLIVVDEAHTIVQW